MTTSWELVGAAQRGDQRAFGQLYERHVDTVFRYVLARVGDRVLAEDVTSETFLRAWRRIGTVQDQDQGKDLTAWLFTIARNLVVDHLKSSRHRREVLTAEIAAAADQTRDARRAGSSVEDTVTAAETAAQVRGFLAHLIPDQAQCVRLRFFHGRSVPETAAVMGRSDGAVKALQHRALRSLAAAAGDPAPAPVATSTTGVEGSSGVGRPGDGFLAGHSRRADLSESRTGQERSR